MYGEYEQVNGAVANALQAEVDALRKDAERYRWLREQSNLVAGMRGEGIGMACGNWCKDDQDKRTLDAAIDAAMKGANDALSRADLNQQIFNSSDSASA